MDNGNKNYLGRVFGIVLIVLAVAFISVSFSKKTGGTGMRGCSYSTQLNQGNGEGEFEMHEVICDRFTEIEMKFGVGRIEILESDSNNAEIDIEYMYENGYEITCKNGKLTIIDKYKDKKNSFDSYNPHVVIKLPARDYSGKIEVGAGTMSITSFSADGFELEAGAGDMTCKDIYLKDCEISCGACSMKIDGLKGQDVIFECGVGDIDIENINVQDFEVECGVGDAKVAGVLTGTIKIEAGVGNLTINLDGCNVNDYGYVMDKGLGKFKFDGRQIDDKDNNTYNKSAKNVFKYSGGVGNCEINFN